MSQARISEIASCQHQLIGYWGYGDAIALSHSLKQIIQKCNANQNWKFSEISSDRITATLSASRLSSHPDIWIKAEENRLSLGRQAFGRVTLYWLHWEDEQVIWFASNFQLLLSLRDFPKDSQVSPEALYGYSCLSYVPTPLTPVMGINSLPAGIEQTWQLRDGNLSSHSKNLQDWQQLEQSNNSESEAISQLQVLLKRAIERQIQDLKNETVGVFLSGGLDSAIAAALLVQMGIKVQAYTLDFGDPNSESPYAKQVAQHLNIPLTKVDASPQKIRKALTLTVKALDLPFGDGVTVPLFLLCEAAKQEVGIIFNGEGGDQLFAGWTNKPLIAASIYQTAQPNALNTFEAQYLQTFHRLWGYESQVFSTEVCDKIQHLNPQDWLKLALNSPDSHQLLHRLRRASLMLKGAQNIHPRATNLAFYHGLSVRSLFCDLDLTEWTFQQQSSLFLQGSCEKYILKRAVEDWLPPEIVWRQKRGMGVPLSPWLLNNLWFSLGTWLNPSILEAEGRWQSEIGLRVALGELGRIQGRRVGEILWLLIVWQIWRSQVLGEKVEDYSWTHPFWLPYRFWKFKRRLF
jgi:asparagine synthase (glutamine-hydrolysing)